MPRIRFRVRTLLVVLATGAVAAGVLRWRYNSAAAAQRRDQEVVQSDSFAKTDCRWQSAGRLWPRQFRRVEHVWCEECPELSRLAPRIGELTELQSIQVLARQILGHAALANEGEADPLIAALQSHPSLREIIVDASVRGAPLESGAPLATRKDLAMLQAVLPNVEIVWIEVN
jgi:hypothetical protein